MAKKETRFLDLKHGDLVCNPDHGTILTIIAVNPIVRCTDPHDPYADFYPTYEVVLSDGTTLGINENTTLEPHYFKNESVEEGKKFMDSLKKREYMTRFKSVEFVIRKHPFTNVPAVFKVVSDPWGPVESLEFYSYDRSIVLLK